MSGIQRLPKDETKTAQTGNAPMDPATARTFISAAPDHKPAVEQAPEREFKLTGKKRKLSPVIDPDLLDEFDEVVADLCISRNAVLTMAMRMFINDHNRKKREQERY